MNYFLYLNYSVPNNIGSHLKNRALLFSTLVFLASLFSGCNSVSSPSAEEPKPSEAQVTARALDTLRLALDWRPNVLHSGVFYAQAQGWYQQAGIYLEWFTPEIDGYTVKPLNKVLASQADLAVGPSEHLFHYAVQNGQVKAQAIASLLQEDRSAFVVKKSSGIERPQQMEGKTYLGYNTPLENEILEAMLQHDDASGDFNIQAPGRLELWEAFKQGKGDIAWVFLHWEAMQAQQEGLALNTFKPADFGVPYGYSSVIMAPKPLPKNKVAAVKTFLAVSKKGYAAFKTAPQEALVRVVDFIDHPNFKDSAFISLAQENITPAYFNSTGQWGVMQAKTWQTYLNWMQAKNVVDHQKVVGLKADAFFTNRYLPAK
jgi:NitT/TauT family transport system substrate-binding protein